MSVKVPPTSMARVPGRAMVADILGELAGLFTSIGAQGDDDEERRVAGEPEEADVERLGGRAHRAPGELAVVVRGEVRGDALYEAGKLAHRHEEPGGEGKGQVDEVRHRGRRIGADAVADGEAEP